MAIEYENFLYISSDQAFTVLNSIYVSYIADKFLYCIRNVIISIAKCT
jgi:hypothetical protein